MEFNNQEVKQAYRQLLIETLRKKKQILTYLMNISEQQDSVISSEHFDEAVFLETISIKEQHILTLNELDEGFERLYEGVKEELIQNKEGYKTEIMTMKELISDITDLSVKLQALEKRNKAKMEAIFARKRKGIKESRLSSRTAASYYKAMSQQQDVSSIFYDEKN